MCLPVPIVRVRGERHLTQRQVQERRGRVPCLRLVTVCGSFVGIGGVLSWVTQETYYSSPSPRPM